MMRCESLLGEYFGYIKDVDSRLFIDYCIDSNTVLKELQVTHNLLLKVLNQQRLPFQSLQHLRSYDNLY